MKPHVLKESEMAVSFNDQPDTYVGEAGNPSGCVVEMLYDPSDHLLMAGRRMVRVELHDLLKLPQDHGYLPIREAFGPTFRSCNHWEFVSVEGQWYRRAHKILQAIFALGTMMGPLRGKRDFDEIDGAIKQAHDNAHREDRYPRPEEIFDVLIDRIVREDRNRGVWEEQQPLKETLRRCGLTDLQRPWQEVVVYFCYPFIRMYSNLHGIDQNNPEEVVRALESYPLIMDLMQKKKDSSEYVIPRDGRFGDTLLVATDVLQKKWDTARAADEASD